MNQRAKEKLSDEENDSVPEKLTQIVCAIFGDYGIKSTGFSKYLPEAPKEGEDYQNKLGLTFLFCRDDKDKLPRYCGDIIYLNISNNNTGYGYVVPRYSVMIFLQLLLKQRNILIFGMILSLKPVNIKSSMSLLIKG